MNKQELKKLIADSNYFPEDFISDFNNDVDEVGDILLKQEEEKKSLKEKIKEKNNQKKNTSLINMNELFDYLSHTQKYELYKLRFMS